MTPPSPGRSANPLNTLSPSSGENAKSVSVRAEVSRIRRQASETSLSVFLHSYLRHYCGAAPSEMHRELFRMLEAATTSRGQRIAVAAPRGHAKTTLVSTAYLLWSICYRKEEFVLLVSATSDQASDILSHAKRELETNQFLIEDFPEVCEIPGVPPKAPRWRKSDIITRNGVKVTAVGEGTSIRGRKYKQHRPTLILVDDLEIRERVFSEEQRCKTREWFEGALSKMGSAHTTMVVVGTILHYDSLLCRLTDHRKAPGWTGRIYRAVIEWPERSDLWCEWENIYRHRVEFDGATGPDAALAYFRQREGDMLLGAKVLWPEREPFYDLMVTRERESRSTFDSEKQNEPIDLTECLFPESEMHFWDDHYDTLDDLLTAVGNYRVILGACDPSMGRAGRAGSGKAPGYGGGDYSAIIMLLWDVAKGVVNVIDADIRHRKPDVLINDVLSLYRHRDCDMLAFEVNGFQEFLAGQLLQKARERGMHPEIKGITNHTDKRGRIQRLQPMIRSGQIRFSRRHTLLLEQLRQFPLGAHDDGPDALEMAIHLADALARNEVDVGPPVPLEPIDHLFHPRDPIDHPFHPLEPEDIRRFEMNLLAAARRQGMKI